MVFALSASSSDANSYFQKMKDILKAMIDTYGKDQVQYSLITFGDTPSVKVNFTYSFPTDGDLKALINAVPRSSGSPALAEALGEAQKLFEGTASRKSAKKILVIMMDNKSSSRIEDIKKKGKSLDGTGVRVIAVGFGNQADLMELNSTTTHKGDIITTTKTGDPEQIAKEIMAKGLEKR